MSASAPAPAAAAAPATGASDSAAAAGAHATPALSVTAPAPAAAASQTTRPSNLTPGELSAEQAWLELEVEAAREGHLAAQRCSSAEWRPLPGQEPLVVPDGMRVPKTRMATVATRPKQDKDKAMPHAPPDDGHAAADSEH